MKNFQVLGTNVRKIVSSVTPRCTLVVDGPKGYRYACHNKIPPKGIFLLADIPMQDLTLFTVRKFVDSNLNRYL